MTLIAPTGVATGPVADVSVARRLRPLAAGVALQNVLLWVPVEKVFMTEIGFTAASIGIVAAVYAAVVPALEVPFGVLADRWSRAGLLILSTVALAGASLVGGLSQNPATYAFAAVLLGVFFALSSGTAESIVYDTLVEETGSSDGYEKWIGRLHIVEALALVASSVVGGILAAVYSARITYFATVPIVACAAVAFLRCREPQLHRAGERVSYQQQAVATIRALTGRPELRRVIALFALTAVVAQVLFEFGPLWLVAAHAPSSWYGPYWAALVSTVGLGAWLTSRVDLNQMRVAAAAGALVAGAALVLVGVSSVAVVIAMQIVIALVAAMVSVRASLLLHDAVVATIRAGVASGASTLGWVTFVPVSLVFGWLTRTQSLQTAAWLLVLLTASMAALLLRLPRPRGSQR